MKKIRTLVKAPALVNAGYGVHSRQIIRALLKDPIFDVYVENLNWGMCSHLTHETEEKESIKRLVERYTVEKLKGNNNFDLFIHVTIPNEFERKGTFNVGVTAGIETDRVSHVWIQKCNEMDLIIVPSEHSKNVLARTVIDWENPQTKERGSFSLQKPIEVCHEGVNTEIFHPLGEDDLLPSICEPLAGELPPFNFLHVGQWGKGGFGEDRKNIANLVKYFIEEFRGRKDVGLVLKVNMARNSVSDYQVVSKRLQEIKSNFKAEEVPPIFLLHANLTEEEMSSLYNHPKIKAMISLTHGEGFGLPLLEAASCNLPVVATNWSGHLDFLKLGKFIPLEFDLKEVPDAVVWDNIIIKGSRWASVRESDVKNRMQKLVASRDKPAEWAQDLGEKIRESFNLDTVCEKFISTIKSNMMKETIAKIDPLEHLQSFIDTPDNFNVLYTMPMSTGDVFISTAVIDGLIKELPTGAKIYFATKPEYFDVLKGNPYVHKVIPWNETMMTMDLLEGVFDLALTPNVATQYVFSNWVRRGQGRLLAEEFANHCGTQLGEYFIEKDAALLDSAVEIKSGAFTFLKNELFMTFHPGSGTGQWEGRRYEDWQEVITNLKNLYPTLNIVQVGSVDEPSFEGVDVDLRGKTSHQQLAAILEHSKLHLSIDTFTMHLAAALGTPLVALFGCSYATSTGPWVKDKSKAKYILLQSERLSGCKEKACYKNRCISNPDGNGPINEIDPREVFQACAKLLQENEQ